MDHQEAVRDLAFAPDGSLRLVTASLDRTIKVYKDLQLTMIIVQRIN